MFISRGGIRGNGGSEATMLPRFRSWLRGFPSMVTMWSGILTMLSRFRSWLRGLPSVVTMWSAIFTIGFCGVYILVNLGIISPGKSTPPDCVLGADLVTHGQQITCTGKDLDLVAEFRLVRGNNSYQVPFTFHNESRTVLIVTSVTPPWRVSSRNNTKSR